MFLFWCFSPGWGTRVGAWWGAYREARGPSQDIVLECATRLTPLSAMWLTTSLLSRAWVFECEELHPAHTQGGVSLETSMMGGGVQGVFVSSLPILFYSVIDLCHTGSYIATYFALWVITSVSLVQVVPALAAGDLCTPAPLSPCTPISLCLGNFLPFCIKIWFVLIVLVLSQP